MLFSIFNKLQITVKKNENTTQMLLSKHNINEEPEIFIYNNVYDWKRHKEKIM